MTKPPKSKPLLQDIDAPVRSRPRRKRVPEQPALAFDPMPDRVEPTLALLKKRPPADDYAWEIKWDGYRVHVHIEHGRVRVITRGGHDWSHRFPAIVEAAEKLGPATMILDGEALMFDNQGRSDFNLLQASLGANGKAQGSLVSPAVMMAFDLLYFDGHDLRGVEYSSRRHLLEDLLTGNAGAIRLSEVIDADADSLLEHACQLGLEGIVGKSWDSAYRSGRTGDWIKCKCVQSEAFVVVGYEPSDARPEVSHLCFWRPTPAGFWFMLVALGPASNTDRFLPFEAPWTNCCGGGNSLRSTTTAPERSSGFSPR